MRLRLLRTCAFFVCVCSGNSVLSQVVYGSIFGKVTDPSGAAIAGALVTIVDVARGASEKSATNEIGNYLFTHLAPGVYDVTVQASGFKRKAVSRVNVFADEGIHVDFSLDIGAANESVTIRAEDVPSLKTDRADVATSFTDREVTNLPLFNRNFTELQLATAGAKKLDWQHFVAGLS